MQYYFVHKTTYTKRLDCFDLKLYILHDIVSYKQGSQLKKIAPSNHYVFLKIEIISF